MGESGKPGKIAASILATGTIARVKNVTDCASNHDRVAWICGMMRDDEWIRGKSGPILAVEWGLSEYTVDKYAAEASRRVLSEIKDPDALMRTGLTKLETIIDDSLTDAKTEEGASLAHQHRKVASDAIHKLLTLAGAAAPQKVVLELEKLSDEEVERRYTQAQKRLLGQGEDDE